MANIQEGKRNRVCERNIFMVEFNSVRGGWRKKQELLAGVKIEWIGGGVSSFVFWAKGRALEAHKVSRPSKCIAAERKERAIFV